MVLAIVLCNSVERAEFNFPSVTRMFTMEAENFISFTAIREMDYAVEVLCLIK